MGIIMSPTGREFSVQDSVSLVVVAAAAWDKLAAAATARVTCAAIRGT